MQKSEADQRLAIFDHRRGLQFGLLGAVATLLICVLLIVGEVVKIAATEVASVSIDFYVFWAAAKLALQGLPLDAFDIDRIAEIAGATHGDWSIWAYPPGFLVLILPLGVLPFGQAWYAFTVVSVAALVLAVRPFATGRIQVVCAAALAPAIVPSLLVGQTSALWAAGLIAALAALKAERPAIAGFFIGLLTLKPQLGLLIPVALIACGAWRTILSAAITAGFLVAVPTAVFGTAYWPEMLAMMGQHGEVVRNAVADLTLMISPYSALAGLGVAEPAALKVQWAVTTLCAIAVFLTWRKPASSFDLRAAVLLTAIPLASPYLWHYESALLAPGALFMVRAGVLSATPGGMALGLLMWLGLGPSALAIMEIGDADIFRFVFVPVALAALAVCLLRVFAPSRDPVSKAIPL